jgi:hypothetical protein
VDPKNEGIGINIIQAIGEILNVGALKGRVSSGLSQKSYLTT